jgi:hypothetical protein
LWQALAMLVRHVCCKKHVRAFSLLALLVLKDKC